VWPEAEQAGVSRATFESATRGLAPDFSLPDLVLPGRPQRPEPGQPEFVQSAADYLKEANIARLAGQARALLAAHRETLSRIEREYGVPPAIVLAIWGRETAFGTYKLPHDALRVLATQAYAGRRKDQFRQEFVLALKMLGDREVALADFRSSWAGAMGMTQFLPSEFYKYAVDFDGDGRRDIWTTIPDALASTANYLHRMGWRSGETWGYEVRALPGFDLKRAARRGTLTIAQWEKLGLRRVEGKSFPRPSDRAYFYQPAGVNGPAFLLLPNFKVIKRYNNSNFYALAVGHLADRIRGGGPFVTPWPPDEALSRKEGKELQALLNRHGFPVGTPDGVVGPQTQDAIRSFQQYAGLEVDGYPTTELIKRLRAID
jgi:lytic murein transglycosylase